MVRVKIFGLGPVVIILLAIPFCSAIMSASPNRRQAVVPPSNSPPVPRFPSGDLLPPPALSASFPTLRPRRPAPPGQNQPPRPINNSNGGTNQPPRDLIPPFRTPPSSPSLPNAPPRRPQQNSPPASPSTTPLPLLPPIEIPPERPLTDNEILATLVPKETSFIPTTGQGVPTPSIGISIPPGAAPAASPVSLQQTNSIEGNSSSSSVVRFPTDSDSSLASSPQLGSPPPRNCPSCECTNEVDYICASNGVLYLNSCSFDCATFCDSGIRKVELRFCASQNQQKSK